MRSKESHNSITYLTKEIYLHGQKAFVIDTHKPTNDRVELYTLYPTVNSTCYVMPLCMVKLIPNYYRWQ